MYKRKTYLAIIPARGGSKRLPGKNTLNLAGKPLIAWSIEAGLKSKYIDKVIVSSDDNEILAIANHFKADTVKRPNSLASDITRTFDVLQHTINNTKEYDYIVLLQPTSPLRDASHIDDAIELLDIKNADAVISVTNMEHSPLWCNTLSDGLSMKSFINKEILDLRSQDLEQYYRLNGAIYICDTKRLLQEKSFFIQNNIFAYIMNNNVSVDIDEKVDFILAKLLMEKKYRKIV